MDILWSLLTLPYAPVRGLTSVIKVIAREAESRRYDPANVRRELDELDRAAAAGDITDAERDRAQQQVLDRLTGTVAGSARPAVAAAPGRPDETDQPGRARTARRSGAARSAPRRRQADRRGDPRRRRER
ncbi:gas vesicle protein GvpG [Micromonospora psammae]|uniref:gas vesicle protein GvpG n=1 Tax=Micromonospora sp. CPCC 205556 TaxID=3122398 RepID=UPI002FEE8586